MIVILIIAFTALLMKLGYVAVKSNTCPRIVFTDEDEPV